MRRLPTADRAKVARAVRKGVLPADPALDGPALALTRSTRDKLCRFTWLYRWPPVALAVLAAAMFIVSRTEQALGTTVVLTGVAVLGWASVAQMHRRLDRLESAIGRRDQDAPSAPGPRRRMRAPSPATAATAAGIVLVASGLWLQWDAHRDRHDWTLDGPHGTFPPPIAAQAPQHPQKVLASYPFDVLTYRGVAIRADRNSGTVTAYGIHPATTYWRFTRRDHRLVDAALDPATGRLLLVWGDLDMGGEPLQAMVIDVRTGKVRWTRTMPGDSTFLRRGSFVLGRTAAIPDDGLNVLDTATGRVRWRLSDRCDETAAGTIGRAVIVKRQCPAAGLLLEGYDAATGHRLWSKSFASWFPGREHARELPVEVGGLSGDRIAVWSLEHEAVYDAETGAAAGSPTGGHGRSADIVGEATVFDAETGYSPCWIPPFRSHHMGVCATDPVSGHRLWRFPFPGDGEAAQLTAPVAVADGRVYTLSGDHGGETVDYIDVNDARTGTLLARVSTTFPRADHPYSIQAVTGGALVITDEFGSSAQGVTVVLGDG